MKRKVLPLMLVLLIAAILAGCTASAERAPAAPSTTAGTADTAAPVKQSSGTGTQTNTTQPAPPPKQPQGPTGPAAGDITATLTVPAQLDLAQGKPAIFALDLHNNVAAMTITYNSGQQYDFWVTQNDKVIWRWSEGRMFTQVVTNQTFNADGRLHFEVKWDGKDNTGKPVPPGAYMVFARWAAHTELAGTPQPASQSISVR